MAVSHSGLREMIPLGFGGLLVPIIINALYPDLMPSWLDIVAPVGGAIAGIGAGALIHQSHSKGQ